MASAKMRKALPASFKSKPTKTSDWVYVKNAAATHGVYPPRKRWGLQKRKSKSLYSDRVKAYLQRAVHLPSVHALMKQNVGLELLPLTQHELMMLIDAPDPTAAVNAIHIISDNDHTFDFTQSLQHAKRINNAVVTEVLNERV